MTIFFEGKMIEMKREIKKAIAAALALTITSSGMAIPSFAVTNEGVVDEPMAIGYSSADSPTGGGEINCEDGGSFGPDSASPSQYSGILPITFEDGRVVWLRWYCKPGEEPYQEYWYDGVKIAETEEELDEWYYSSVSDSDSEEEILVTGPPLKGPTAPEDVISNALFKESNTGMSDKFDEEELILNKAQSGELRTIIKNIAVSDYIGYVLASIDKDFYGETSFISLDDFIDADEAVCVNKECHANVSLDFLDEDYEEKVIYHARNFYCVNEFDGVAAELYAKSTAEGSLRESLIENSTQTIFEKCVYKNDDESVFLGEINYECVVAPYSEMISGTDALYEMSIIISFDGIEMYSDDTIKELDGYILKKVLFTCEDDNIVIEDEGEENYCMVTESEVTYDEFMEMVENYENELEIRIY